MVAIRDAVSIAQKTLGDFFPDVAGVQLEEILVSDDERYWWVTLSYLAPLAEKEVPPRSIYAEAIRRAWESSSGFTGEPRLVRIYKSFGIDRQSGEFHEMKIREFPGE